MRALDDKDLPNFGDADYQLAAYAAALQVRTKYKSLDGRDVGEDFLNASDSVKYDQDSNSVGRCNSARIGLSHSR